MMVILLPNTSLILSIPPLSQNFIYTIFEDRDGTIWTSSFEGLCASLIKPLKNFTRYKPSPHGKFSDPNITAINEDADGMMWLGSASGGLAGCLGSTARGDSCATNQGCGDREKNPPCES